ncbi:MAG: ThiF family adenylyltransferase [Phycisphaerales bacterium]|nr:ThiF family adenylyltransferase [Phycisphaerales bacterium]
MGQPDRYSRQRRVAGIGETGQTRLREATVLVVGCGALGTHALDALTRAGVGRLLVVDRDVVEWSNLQRQVLFREADAIAGLPKAVAAAQRLGEVNHEVAVVPFVAQCSGAFLARLPVQPDVVLDGTDNFHTRYLINDWCRSAQVPWIYAGAVGAEAVAMAFPVDGPCLRCVWPDPPAAAEVGNCETQGILAPAIAVVAAFQVAEAIKALVGAPPTRGALTVDVWRGRYGVADLVGPPSTTCPCCARREFPALRDVDVGVATTLCGRDAVQVEPARGAVFDLAAYADRVAPAVSDLMRTPHLVRFNADGVRFSVFRDGRALLFGVADLLRARALYDRWVGA